MASQRTTTWILLALVTLFAGVGLWFAQREQTPREVAHAPATDREAETPITQLEHVEPIAERREPLNAEVTPSATTTDSTDVLLPPYPIVRGRVLDANLLPVAGASITREVPDALRARELATSDVDGWFQFDARQTEYILVANTPALRAVRVMIWRWQLHEEKIIVVAPCRTLTGVVVDESDKPLAGVELSMNPQAVGVEATTAREFVEFLTASSDARGQFTIERAFASSGARLKAELDGYEPTAVEVSRLPDATVRMVLKKAWVPEEHVVTGVVLRQNGEPALDASVLFAGARAGVNERGEFRLQFERYWNDASELIAAEPGSQAAVMPGFGSKLSGDTAEFGPVVLTLGPPTLSIAGFVLDADGQPLQGCTVSLLDPTEVKVHEKTRTLESLSRASETCSTDAKGHFEIAGLFPREYRLTASVAKKSFSIESPAVPAGTRDVVLRLPTDAIVKKIAGRVLARDGTPIAGAGLTLMPTAIGSAPAWMRQTESGADGSFEISDVPRRHTGLEVSGSDIVRKRVALDDFDLDRRFVIEVERWCECKYDGPPSGIESGWLTALDAKGNRTKLMTRHEQKTSWTALLRMNADTARSFWVGENTVELVLISESETPLARRRVRIVAGEVNVVSW